MSAETIAKAFKYKSKTEGMSHEELSKRNAIGETHLHDRAHAGYSDVLKHPEVATSRGWNFHTPLHYLGISGNADTLKHPEASTVQDRTGNTPLHYVASTGHPEAKDHPDFNKVKNKLGQTPKDLFKKIVIGKSSSEYSISKAFTPKGTINTNDPSLTQPSVHGDHQKVLSGDTTDHLNHEGDTQLHRIAYTGHPAVLKHPQVSTLRNSRGDTPLHYLGYTGHSSVLKHPEASTVKNMHGDTPLHHVAFTGNKKVLNHPDVSKVKDRGGNTPLHDFAASGNAAVLKHPDANTIKNHYGKTPADIYHNEIKEQSNTTKSSRL